MENSGKRMKLEFEHVWFWSLGEKRNLNVKTIRLEVGANVALVGGQVGGNKRWSHSQVYLTHELIK